MNPPEQQEALMKLRSSVLIVAVCAGLLAGCGKQETQPPTPTAPPVAETPKAAAEMQKTAEAIPPAAQQAASSIAEGAQGMIDKAKALIADSKYSEAMDLLKRLSSMQLTPEQRKLVDDLMAQVEQAMPGAAAAEATQKARNAVGGMLGGNQ
jgi:hypothetical protein